MEVDSQMWLELGDLDSFWPMGLMVCEVISGDFVQAAPPPPPPGKWLITVPLVGVYCTQPGSDRCYCGKDTSRQYPATSPPCPLWMGRPVCPLTSGPIIRPPLQQLASCTASAESCREAGSVLASQRAWELPLISLLPSPCRW